MNGSMLSVGWSSCCNSLLRGSVALEGGSGSGRVGSGLSRVKMLFSSPRLATNWYLMYSVPFARKDISIPLIVKRISPSAMLCMHSAAYI